MGRIGDFLRDRGCIDISQVKTTAFQNVSKARAAVSRNTTKFTGLFSRKKGQSSNIDYDEFLSRHEKIYHAKNLGLTQTKNLSEKELYKALITRLQSIPLGAENSVIKAKLAFNSLKFFYKELNLSDGENSKNALAKTQKNLAKAQEDLAKNGSNSQINYEVAQAWVKFYETQIAWICDENDPLNQAKFYSAHANLRLAQSKIDYGKSIVKSNEAIAKLAAQAAVKVDELIKSAPSSKAKTREPNCLLPVPSHTEKALPPLPNNRLTQTVQLVRQGGAREALNRL